MNPDVFLEVWLRTPAGIEWKTTRDYIEAVFFGNDLYDALRESDEQLAYLIDTTCYPKAVTDGTVTSEER